MGAALVPENPFALIPKDILRNEQIEPTDHWLE